MSYVYTQILQNVIIQIIKYQNNNSSYPMKTSVILSSSKPSQIKSQTFNKIASRPNRINSIQIIKNINRDAPRSNMFSLPKTQPTKNSSSHRQDDPNASQSQINNNIDFTQAAEHADQRRDNEPLNETQHRKKEAIGIGRSMSTNRAMFKKRRMYQNMDINVNMLSKQLLQQIQQIQTCPQVEITQFCSNFDTSFYLHKMDIDYGRLHSPITCFPSKTINNSIISKDKDCKNIETQLQELQQLQTLRNVQKMRNCEGIELTTQKPKNLINRIRQAKSSMINDSNNSRQYEEQANQNQRSKQKQERLMRWNKQIKQMKDSFIKILNNNQQGKFICKSASISKSKERKNKIRNEISIANINSSTNFKQYFCPKLKQVVAAQIHNHRTFNTYNRNHKSLMRTKNNSMNHVNNSHGSQFQIPQEDMLIQPLPKCVSISQQSTQRYHNQSISTHGSAQLKSSIKGQIRKQVNKQNSGNHIPHCRIVRSYVGGGKMQIKIINYPDNSQYMKVCGYENSSSKKRK